MEFLYEVGHGLNGAAGAKCRAEPGYGDEDFGQFVAGYVFLSLLFIRSLLRSWDFSCVEMTVGVFAIYSAFIKVVISPVSPTVETEMTVRSFCYLFEVY